MDALRRQRIGEAGHLVEDLAVGHHDDQDGKQRKAHEGADDVEGVLGRGVVASPGDGAGQSVGLGGVLAPAEEREAGPHRRHQPDDAAHQPDVGGLQPRGCKKRKTTALERSIRPLSVHQGYYRQ